MLKAFQEALQASGTAMKVVAAYADGRDMLRVEGLENLLGHIGGRGSLADLTDGFLSSGGVAGPDVAARASAKRVAASVIDGDELPARSEERPIRCSSSERGSYCCKAWKIRCFLN
jgi:hypothetical protein